MTFEPRRLEELQQAIASSGVVSIRGASTKAATTPASAVLRTTGLTGITEYVADECVLTARGGTPLVDIIGVLAAHGQYLPFDPPFAAAGATIGGTIASGLSGPGRYRYGGIRDFLIGATIVDGEGRVVRSGGKVVKNAAGFLLHHAIVGSAGRYGVIADATFKVFPAPEARATLSVRTATPAAALSALAILARERFDLDAADADRNGALWIRFAGRAAMLPQRVDRAERALRAASAELTIDRLTAAADRQFWEDAAEFRWAPNDAPLIKVASTPAALARLAALGDESTPMRFSSGGAITWMSWTGSLEALAAALAPLALPAVVVRGAAAGHLIGSPPNAFGERVRGVLDPRNRFDAAPASAR